MMYNAEKIGEIGVATYEKNFFRIALLHLLEEKGRGADTEVAIGAGLSNAQFSRIKTGKSAGSVYAREAIARALGKTYKEMLTLGEDLEGKKPEDSVKEKEKTYNIEKTKRIIEMLEQFDRDRDKDAIDHLFSDAQERAQNKRLKAQLDELEKIIKKKA